MTSMAQRRLQSQLCSCRAKRYALKKKPQDHCKRKRQTFVYNVEEEIWHEPYMHSLRREFSAESVLCDSKIELPWKDIVLPAAGMRIRPDVALQADVPKAKEADVREVAGEIEKKASTGAMRLPWKDLLITETLGDVQDPDGPVTCDSSVEIPWADLTLENTMEIRSPREETCALDDVEIPWDKILVPRNIVIESEKKKKHPSSEQPPRARLDAACAVCGTVPCCATTHGNNVTVLSAYCM